MKVSVSLPGEDLAFVDDYAKNHGTSRSAALHEAIMMLRRQGLGEEYEAAADEWDAGGEAAVWDAVRADGLA
jgi:Arc/MetJ-type ribon-helix-helix transcriptional regulator